MSVRIREIEIPRTTRLDYYRQLDHLCPTVTRLHREGRQLAEALGSGRIWMLNSTASGGGVAEMMPRLCALMADAGLDVHWLVLEPQNETFFRLTKDLHNQLHGSSGSSGSLRLGDFGRDQNPRNPRNPQNPRNPGNPVDPERSGNPANQRNQKRQGESGQSTGNGFERERALYEEVSTLAARKLQQLSSEDVLVVHDPQPAGVAAHLRAQLRPRLVWRCHIGTSEPNEHTAAAWHFLEPFLEPYQRTIFSAASYIPDFLLPRSGLIAPGIDPLSHKNRELRPYKLNGILRAAGLSEGPDLPEWTRFEAPAQRWIDGEWRVEAIPKLLFLPFILQVSRFDRLKGFQYLIPAFAELLKHGSAWARHVDEDVERVEAELCAVQLMLAGPDPAGVADDPEALDLLEELCAQVDALPEEIRSRIHLLRLPMRSTKENALTVNALQRQALVVVQNSQQEGFGLTAAEALWKGSRVVAANRGGLALQVRHGSDGLLIFEPDQPMAIARTLFQALCRAKKMEPMAITGRVRVREHFLVLSQLSAWFRELRILLGLGEDGTGA